MYDGDFHCNLLPDLFCRHSTSNFLKPKEPDYISVTYSAYDNRYKVEYESDAAN